MPKRPNHLDEGIDFGGIAFIRWSEVPNWRLEARDEHHRGRQISRIDNLSHDFSVSESASEVPPASADLGEVSELSPYCASLRSIPCPNPTSAPSVCGVS
jgi:hypothetical protein